MPDVPDSSLSVPVLHLAGAFLSSAVYALLLNTRLGRRWADEQTWATVVAGSALTLGWLATWQPLSAAWALLFFVATGIPIIVQSLARQLERISRVYDRHIGREE